MPGPNFQEPATDCLVGDVDTALGEDLLDVTIGQREPGVEPDPMTDDRGREAVALERERVIVRGYNLSPWPTSLPNVTTPFRQ